MNFNRIFKVKSVISLVICAKHARQESNAYGIPVVFMDVKMAEVSGVVDDGEIQTQINLTTLISAICFVSRRYVQGMWINLKTSYLNK